MGAHVTQNKPTKAEPPLGRVHVGHRPNLMLAQKSCAVPSHVPVALGLITLLQVTKQRLEVGPAIQATLPWLSLQAQRVLRDSKLCCLWPHLVAGRQVRVHDHKGRIIDLHAHQHSSCVGNGTEKVSGLGCRNGCMVAGRGGPEAALPPHLCCRSSHPGQWPHA